MPSKYYNLTIFKLINEDFILTKGTQFDPICGPEKRDCTERVVIIMNSREFKSIKSSNDSLDINKCNCLPACTTIKYSTEISQSMINWKQYVDGLTGGTNKHYDKYILSILFYY